MTPEQVIMPVTQLIDLVTGALVVLAGLMTVVVVGLLWINKKDLELQEQRRLEREAVTKAREAAALKASREGLEFL